MDGELFYQKKKKEKKKFDEVVQTCGGFLVREKKCFNVVVQVPSD